LWNTELHCQVILSTGYVHVICLVTYSQLVSAPSENLTTARTLSGSVSSRLSGGETEKQKTKMCYTIMLSTGKKEY